MQESKNFFLDLHQKWFILILPRSLSWSPIGLDVVLPNITEEGEKPIDYVSRTLAPAEKNYSQLENCNVQLHSEWKNRFLIYSDHKPFFGVFKHDWAILTINAAEFRDMLWSYKFEILYKEGKKNGIAGWLKFVEVPLPGETSLHIEHWKSISVHGEEFEEDTEIGPIPASGDIFDTYIYRINGHWRTTTRNFVLSAHEGCILWGARLVIPELGREKVLNLLHEGHPGLVKMKNLASSHLW